MCKVFPIKWVDDNDNSCSYADFRIANLAQASDGERWKEEIHVKPGASLDCISYRIKLYTIRCRIYTHFKFPGGIASSCDSSISTWLFLLIVASSHSNYSQIRSKQKKFCTSCRSISRALITYPWSRRHKDYHSIWSKRKEALLVSALKTLFASVLCHALRQQKRNYSRKTSWVTVWNSLLATGLSITGSKRLRTSLHKSDDSHLSIASWSSQQVNA